MIYRVTYFYADGRILSLLVNTQEDKVQGYPYIRQMHPGSFTFKDREFEEMCDYILDYHGQKFESLTWGQVWRIDTITVVPEERYE